MHRQQLSRTGLDGHLARLLRVGVATNPWVVCANANDGQVHAAALSQRSPMFLISAVAAVQNARVCGLE